MIREVIERGNYVGGFWENQGSGKHLTLRNKFTQTEFGDLPLASLEQVEKSVLASHEGFAVMRQWSAGKKSEQLEKLLRKLTEHSEDFINIIVDEAGKPRSYAMSEVTRAKLTLKMAVHESLQFGGENVPVDFANGEGKIAITKRVPVGPVLCICPFNFPLNLVLHKIAPALAVGCSVIVKPPPQAPLAALLLARLMEEVGYPKGAISVLVCGITEAESMVRDDRIAMVSFTGSDKVGWHIKDICGRKKVALELGGNGAAIVDDGADLAVAAKTLANGAYLYAGQICISTQRIYVGKNNFDAFVNAFTEETKKLRIGDPQELDVAVGPLIDEGSLERVKYWVDEAVQQGAQIIFGGKVIDAARNLYEPTLLTNTNQNMKVVNDEVFGPVAIIEKTANFSESLARVNDSRFGLQTGVFTSNIDRMKEAFDVLEVGGVIINNAPGYRVDTMPYGGVKDSGFGREGIRYAMCEMTNIRLMVF